MCYLFKLKKQLSKTEKSRNLGFSTLIITGRVVFFFFKEMGKRDVISMKNIRKLLQNYNQWACTLKERCGPRPKDWQKNVHFYVLANFFLSDFK